MGRASPGPCGLAWDAVYLEEALVDMLKLYSECLALLLFGKMDNDERVCLIHIVKGDTTVASTGQLYTFRHSCYFASYDLNPRLNYQARANGTPSRIRLQFSGFNALQDFLAS